MNRLLLIVLLGGCSASVTSAPARPVSSPPRPRAVAIERPAPVDHDDHPAFLRALANLRAARSYLVRPSGVVVKWDERQAIREIDAAIRELRAAAIRDGQDVTDRVPADRPTWGGRLHRADELLAQARADVAQDDDSRSSRVHALRGRALDHIANAQRYIQDGIADARALEPPPGVTPVGGPAHPAYLHALVDLRFARALLARPTRDAEVRWDARRAIEQIDAAIHQIREAAIDDGKRLDDHPPVDVRQRHRDRIRAAIQLLDKVARNIDDREDNAFARGLRNRALGHIRAAMQFSREAIADRREALEDGRR